VSRFVDTVSLYSRVASSSRTTTTFMVDSHRHENHSVYDSPVVTTGIRRRRRNSGGVSVVDHGTPLLRQQPGGSEQGTPLLQRRQSGVGASLPPSYLGGSVRASPHDSGVQYPRSSRGGGAAYPLPRNDVRGSRLNPEWQLPPAYQADSDGEGDGPGFAEYNHTGGGQNPDFER
jgi:hypothetical protein